MAQKTWDEEKLTKILTGGVKIELKAKTVLANLKEPFSAQLLIEAKEYSAMRNHITRFFAGKKTLYIAFNIFHEKIESELKEAGIDTSEIFFIDMTDSKSGQEKDGENALTIESPKNLAECLSETQSRLGKETIVILDSVSALLVYNDIASTEKFIHTLVSRVHGSKASILIFNTDTNESDATTKTISQFVDKTVRI